MNRIFVEKKPGHTAEARHLLHDLHESLVLPGLKDVRVVQRYDVEGLEPHEFDAAGLLVRVDRIDGADAVRAYKPDPRVYALTVAPEDAWFVAAHWWDVTGASRAGFRTSWIGVDDVALPETAAVPEIAAPDLLTAVHEITARS